MLHRVRFSKDRKNELCFTLTIKKPANLYPYLHLADILIFNMITYEQDPDVVRWGLQLFDGDPYSNCGYCGSVSQHNADCYSDNYVKGYQYDTECSYTGDHNLNVNCLEEELSQLSVNEPIKSFQDEHLQTSFCSQDWFPHSVGYYYAMLF